MTNLEKKLAEANLPSYDSDEWMKQALAKIDAPYQNFQKGFFSFFGLASG